MFIVGDLEANGLLSSDNPSNPQPIADTIWCGTFYVDNEYRSYTPINSKGHPYTMCNWLYYMLINGYYFVCHNVLNYDWRLIRKVTGIKLPEDKLIDTYLLSQMFFPDIGLHSLDAWGTRFGVLKPVHEDWSQYSEEMLHRNLMDTKINVLLFEKLQSKGFKITCQLTGKRRRSASDERSE